MEDQATCTCSRIGSFSESSSGSFMVGHFSTSRDEAHPISKIEQFARVKRPPEHLDARHWAESLAFAAFRPGSAAKLPLER
ncbi:hypothetical protein E4U56_003286 [Claviceps arundinis]|uniref:Uncharacterized protein n=1 Tax=Claviceps arundinis TaxID=1623583 RepID=A0A9P7MP09_9HYPO|nr:hypothetical protein E4U56_003286 [Claviceps arundinis]